MKLYLVRHGESTGNLDRFHQDVNTPLSDLGNRQARELSEKFKAIPIDVILTSHYVRAFETSKIISDKLNKPVEVDEQLREIKRPSEIEGKSTSDNDSVTIMGLIKNNSHDPKWHYSDEENESELIGRAKEFLQNVEKRKEENILAVSHGRIIQAIVEFIILGNTLTPVIYQELKEKLYLSNSGITIVERTNDWHLLTWNDHSPIDTSRD